MDIKTFQADEAAADQRLDRWLSQRLPELSRTQLQTLIQKNRVKVNQQTVTRVSYPLSVGDVIEVSIPPPVEINVEPQNIPLKILYEDDALIAVDKPNGMVVYPAPGHNDGTLINALLHHTTLASIGAPVRPGIVHRLDKETSGVIVVAKTDEAYHRLIEQFKSRTLKKTYLAWVWDNLSEASGRIDMPVGRHPVNRKKMTVSQQGKSAVTVFTVRKRLKDRTLVEIDLLTGRTHQIRVHFSHIKHPVVGDMDYGRKETDSRMMLHAWKLQLAHPITNETLDLEAEIPKAFGI